MNLSTSSSKTFWKKLALFLSLFLILFLGIEIASRWLLKRFVYGSQQYEQSLRYCEAQAPRVELLFCGDSELYYGINPDLLQTPYATHNFAFPAEGIIATYFKLEYYFNQKMFPRLRFLILQFQPHSLDREKRFLLRGHGDFQRFFSFSTLFQIYGTKETLIQALYQSHFLKFRSSLHPSSLVGLVKRRNQPPPEKLLENGYGEADGNLNLLGVQSEVEQKLASVIEPDSTLLEYYEKTIALAQKHGIRVYLLQIPNYLDVYARNTKQTTLLQTYQKNRRLENAFHQLQKKVSTLNLIRVPPEILATEHFRDVAHVNKAGVAHLAHYLSTLLNTLLPVK